VLHVLRGAGQADRRLAVRARSGRHLPRLLDEAGAKGKTIHLPDDITGTTADGEYATFGTRLPDGAKGFDIGPRAPPPRSAT
jgi:hypothetical protein